MVLFIIASGLSLIFGLMDVLNLAHGTAYMLGAYVAFTFATDGSIVGFLLAAAAAVVVGLVFGGVLRQALQPISERGHLEQVLVTLGLVYVFRDVTTAVWGNSLNRVRPPTMLSGPVTLLGQTFPMYRLAVIVLGVVLALAIYVVFVRSQLGATVRAAVEDQAMVAALGVNTTALRAWVFGIGSALAALGGVLNAPLTNVAPGLDDEALLLALVVLVIGGLGSLGGAFVAALVVGQILTTGTALVPEISGFLLFGTMGLILLWRPYGLFGRSPPA